MTPKDPQDKSKEIVPFRCEFCQADDVLTEYESRLFGHQGMQGPEAVRFCYRLWQLYTTFFSF